jgi:hypothetical protein
MNMDESTKSLLLIGASSTGKTHYGGQILGRLRQGSGELKMRKAADNISLFEEVLNCLGQGMPAGHTSVKIYDNIILPLEIPGGVQMDLTKIFHLAHGKRWKKIALARNLQNSSGLHKRISLNFFNFFFTRKVSVPPIGLSCPQSVLFSLVGTRLKILRRESALLNCFKKECLFWQILQEPHGRKIIFIFSVFHLWAEI